MSDLDVRCAVCHVVAGEPCRTLGEPAGLPLLYPHRGRASTVTPAPSPCDVGWHESAGRARSGNHSCIRDHDIAVAPDPYLPEGWTTGDNDHVCRCGDRFSHAAAVGMST
jgi:hypothetical protein